MTVTHRSRLRRRFAVILSGAGGGGQPPPAQEGSLRHVAAPTRDPSLRRPAPLKMTCARSELQAGIPGQFVKAHAGRRRPGCCPERAGLTPA